MPSAPPTAPDLESATAEEVLAYAVEHHHPRLTMACSFQKEESVLLDILLRLAPDARVFTIDTGVLFDETIATWRQVEQRYGVKIEVQDALSPDGVPWTAERCCGVQKVAALERALTGVDAWITGIRREQAATRAHAPKLDWDAARGIWKFNPLADWTDKDVWRYVMEHELPYNPLHDRGYSSIGCAPCTRPGSGREGRWANSEKTECGLHIAGDGDDAVGAGDAIGTAAPSADGLDATASATVTPLPQRDAGPAAPSPDDLPPAAA